MRVVLAAIFGAIAGFVSLALAHEPAEIAPRSGRWRATLISARGLVPGVRVTLLPGRVPGLFLESSRADPLVVLGRAGEPFLRFTSEGVEANRQSPLWRENVRARREIVTVTVDPLAAPDWQRVSRVPRLAWLEFRAWPGTDEPSREALRHVTPPRLAWTIPVRFGGRTTSFFGLTTWQPTMRRHEAQRAQAP